MSIFYDRLQDIRALMRNEGWDAVVITGSDPHSSEYSAPRWHQEEWITGYSGEGDLVVTEDHAGLWTDTRYFIQAEKQLRGTGAELHKTRVPGQVLIPEWLANHFNGREKTRIAVDGLCQSVAGVGDILKAMKGRAEIVDAPDFLDGLWLDRPEIPQTPIITLGAEQVGWTREQKRSWMRRWLIENGHDAILLTALDEIAWMLNVRGQDVDYNPVVMSYLLMTRDSTIWFVKKGPVPDDDDETEDSLLELERDGVSVQAYSEIDRMLIGMAEDFCLNNLFVDPSTLNYHLYTALKESPLQSELRSGKSPVALRKAVKNEVETAGMREAHLEDGIAMEKFLYWLETELAEGTPINEYEAAQKLHSLRAEIPGFRGESFETVSAYGPGAALPHYVTPKGDESEDLSRHGLYLCDSGGQYLFGTTDITRTVPLGPCTEMEKEDYTLVLKGHIDLAKAVFPKGSAGCQIDAIARAPLWNAMRNFGHGTGHGVGFYLNVHEGPADIRQNFNRQPLLPGMVISDEPGIYREGMHGVRHENLLLCVDAGQNEFGHWLRFETLTLCHFDTSAVKVELLDQSERDWLNAYNERVFQTLSPRLPARIAEWLRKKTLPV